MSRLPAAAAVAAAAALLALAGCARPPPAPYVFDAALAGTAPGHPPLRYGRLSRAHFRAASLPGGYPHHAGELGAFSCLTVRATPDSRIRVHALTVDGEPRFQGDAGALRFEAVFLPGCSWWNPRNPASEREYILEHERIHFAISEVFAREQTCRVRAVARGAHTTARTRAAALAKTRSYFQARLDGLTGKLAARHAAFDRETSVGRDPAQQARWERRLEDALLRYARGCGENGAAGGSPPRGAGTPVPEA